MPGENDYCPKKYGGNRQKENRSTLRDKNAHKTICFNHCFYWQQASSKDSDLDHLQRGLYLDISSCPADNGKHRDVSGVYKHVRMRPEASSASVLIRFRYRNTVRNLFFFIQHFFLILLLYLIFFNASC